MAYVEIKKVHLKKGKRKYTAKAIPSYAAVPVCKGHPSIDVVPSGTSRSTYRSTQSSHPRDRSIDHIKKQVKKYSWTLFPEQQYPTRTTNTWTTVQNESPKESVTESARFSDRRSGWPRGTSTYEYSVTENRYGQTDRQTDGRTDKYSGSELGYQVTQNNLVFGFES